MPSAMSAISIDDMKHRAKRMLPELLYDFIEGGVEDETALRVNREAFEKWAFVPRYLIDTTLRSTAHSLFGRGYTAPFGIAPTGFAGLLRPGADLMLARAAEAEGVPYIMSGVSNASLEEAARVAPRSMWYQLYLARDQNITTDMARRAADAGIETLVVTVDLPVASKRERDLRNGFRLPPRISPALMLSAVLHPSWTLGYLKNGGMPNFQNWARYAGDHPTPMNVAKFIRTQSPPAQSWKDLSRLRELWKGKLVVKGLLHPQDAALACEQGADGIVVSNHGGRQLDRALASLDALPSIRRAVGNVPLMLDSGVRRGSDIAIALCLGADFVFSGRSMLYGAVAHAEAGARRSIAILRDELDLTMGQIGAVKVSELHEEFLFRNDISGARG